ncbi:unnamed protein product [Vicia faba]|uniref:Reverse transcriptase n=1 Tax=Vicia faba TaxID=3906 RepID=A0AAV0YEJ7_VICFA|nr:unnamed protein product [Vicia faba]
MKLVTKTIANRIKQILHEVIDAEQSDFVHGILITDNALLAMECFHWMKKKRKGKNGVMALKLDMSKAYHILEWSFVLYGLPYFNDVLSGLLKKETEARTIHGLQVIRKGPKISYILRR